jgi:hypothetical protein
LYCTTIGGWIPGGNRARIAFVADDLRDRQIEIDVRLKIDLPDRDAGQRLRLDVLDTVDIGADRILAVGGDTLLHLLRAEPGFLPDHRDDRDIDFGKMSAGIDRKAVTPRNRISKATT